MRKKMSMLAWALLVLVGGLTGAFTPDHAAASYASQCSALYSQCMSECYPQPPEWPCTDYCDCLFRSCMGWQCP